MLCALRRGQTLVPSIRTISSTYRSTPVVSAAPIWTTLSCITRSRTIQNSFHTTRLQRQQAAAEAANHRDAPAQPISKYQELAQNGLVHPTVVNTIVQRMGITDMTDIQQLTLQECLDGADM